MKKLRILWNSNAVWSTSGYAQAIADLLPKIKEEGYPVAIVNFYGQGGGVFELDGIPQYPAINHTFGSDAMLWHSKDFQADVCFTLQDIWPLNPQDLMQINRWIPWTPVDHDPIPPGVLNNLKFANRVIAMSKFGQKQMADHGISSTFIPHTVDTKIFTMQTTPQVKQKRGIHPEVFVFGMVAANKEHYARKSFQQALDAFKLFLEKVPNALLYIHSDPHFPGGFPIDAYAQFIGIADKVIFPGIEFPSIYPMKYKTGKKEMNDIYGFMDCLLAPSTSEGFCVPIIEAMACGVPVITHDWTAMSELVEDGVTGYKVKPITKVWSSMGSYAAIPDTQDIFDKMMKIYTLQDKSKMRKACRDFVLKNYDLDTIYKQSWSPYLKKLEQEIYPEVIDKPSASAIR